MIKYELNNWLYLLNKLNIHEYRPNNYWVKEKKLNPKLDHVI